MLSENTVVGNGHLVGISSNQQSRKSTQAACRSEEHVYLWVLFDESAYMIKSQSRQPIISQHGRLSVTFWSILNMVLGRKMRSQGTCSAYSLAMEITCLCRDVSEYTQRQMCARDSSDQCVWQKNALGHLQTSPKKLWRWRVGETVGQFIECNLVTFML